MKPYYERDGVVVYCGDNREIVPSLPKHDLLLTDPPYGIGRLMVGGKDTGHWGSLSNGNPWDKEAPSLSFLENSADDKIIWGGNYFPLPPTRCVLAWRKLNAVPTQSGIELAWTNLNKCAQAFDWPSGGAMKRHGHPTEKPVELIAWCLNFSPNSKSVLDPFMGSGTTGVACAMTGRKFIGIEIEEKYCEIAAKRIDRELSQSTFF